MPAAVDGMMAIAGVNTIAQGAAAASGGRPNGAQLGDHGTNGDTDGWPARS